jgi:hypothetical protein
MYDEERGRRREIVEPVGHGFDPRAFGGVLRLDRSESSVRYETTPPTVRSILESNLLQNRGIHARPRGEKQARLLGNWE